MLVVPHATVTNSRGTPERTVSAKLKVSSRTEERRIWWAADSAEQELQKYLSKPSSLTVKGEPWEVLINSPQHLCDFSNGDVNNSLLIRDRAPRIG